MSHGDRHWSVTLAGRRIRGIEIWNGGDLRLGSLLARAGQATSCETDRAAKLARSQCRLAGQVLADQGLPGPLLEQALSRQARLRFGRFMDQAQGRIRIESDAVIPVRASLGKPLDLARSLIDWARPVEPPPASGRNRTWHLRPGGKRIAQTLTELLPPGLRGPLTFWLRTGGGSWQDLRETLIANPRLGSSFVEHLWSWLALLERLDLAICGPGRSNQPRKPAGPDRTGNDSRSGQRAPKTDGPTMPDLPDERDVEALRRWWHQMARRYHPDSNPDADPTAFHTARARYMAALARLQKQS